MERVWWGASLVLGLIACNSAAEEIRSKPTDPSAEFDIVLPEVDTEYPDVTEDTDTPQDTDDTDAGDTDDTDAGDTDADTDVSDTDVGTDTDPGGDTDIDPTADTDTNPPTP